MISEDKNADTRTVIVQGTPLQIEKATELIKEIVVREHMRFSPSGPHEIERVIVTASKAGLVIGKNGVTIKEVSI